MRISERLEDKLTTTVEPGYSGPSMRCTETFAGGLRSLDVQPVWLRALM